MRNLLVIHQGALGDFVATFPAMIRLKNAFHSFGVICQRKLGKMARALGVADDYFPAESAAFASLYSDHADPHIRDFLILYHHIVLFSYSEQVEKAISELTGQKVHRIPPRADSCQQIHVTQHILSQLAECELLRGTEPFSHTDKREPGYDPLRILIHPGSGSKRKNWPLSDFIRLGDRLHSDGMRPEFILGPAEHSLRQTIQNASDKRLHSLSDLAEVLSLFRNAGAFIGNDSGLTHLAAFMGLLTLGIFGPSDPERWKPSGLTVKIVRPDGLDCSPCFESAQTNCEHAECLTRTSPETVLSAFYSMQGLPWQSENTGIARTFAPLPQF